MEILDKKTLADDKRAVTVEYRVILYLLYYLLCAGGLYVGDFVEKGHVEPFWSVTGGFGIFFMSIFSGIIYLCIKLLPQRWAIGVRVILFFPILAAGIFTTLGIEKIRGAIGQDEFALESSFMVVTIVILIELLRFMDHFWFRKVKKH